MPLFLIALLGLGVIAMASGSSKSRRATGAATEGPVEQWATDRQLVVWFAPLGWESQTDCMQYLMPGHVPIDVILTTKGEFWRPNPAPGACPQKCVTAPDLERDFHAWLQVQGEI